MHGFYSIFPPEDLEAARTALVRARCLFAPCIPSGHACSCLYLVCSSFDVAFRILKWKNWRDKCCLCWRACYPPSRPQPLVHTCTGACTINRPLITMHDCDLPTYCCAHGRLIVHAPVGWCGARAVGVARSSVPADQSAARRGRGQEKNAQTTTKDS